MEYLYTTFTFILNITQVNNEKVDDPNLSYYLIV